MREKDRKMQKKCKNNKDKRSIIMKERLFEKERLFFDIWRF